VVQFFYNARVTFVLAQFYLYPAAGLHAFLQVGWNGPCIGFRKC